MVNGYCIADYMWDEGEVEDVNLVEERSGDQCICGSPEELCLGDGARRVREQHPGAAPGQHPPLAPRTARHFEVSSALFGMSIWNIFEGILKHFKIRFVIIRGFMFFSEN